MLWVEDILWITRYEETYTQIHNTHAYYDGNDENAFHNSLSYHTRVKEKDREG